MRLIDADVLSAKVHEWASNEWNKQILPSGLEDDLELMIESAPTVEAEPVKHGHWIVTDNWRICRCSNCESAEFVDWALEQANYCPICGAKMDEEVEREDFGSIL